MGRTRALAGLCELLQQVWVGVAAVSDRFEVLAELVDDQEQRAISMRAAGEGPVRRGSSVAASDRAPLRVLAAGNALAAGILP